MEMAERVDVGLREQLLAVTVDLLAKDGIEALSLREIARRAGVSHGAPLRHFRSLSSLLSAVAAQGFRQLYTEVDAAVAATGPKATARDRAAAAIRAYAGFGLANRGHFILMFRSDLLDFSGNDLIPTGFAAFDQGVDLVRAYQADGWHPDQNPRLLHGAMWAAIHGATSLWAQNSMQGVSGARSFEELLEPLIAVVLDGPSVRKPRRRRKRR